MNGDQIDDAEWSCTVCIDELVAGNEIVVRQVVVREIKDPRPQPLFDELLAGILSTRITKRSKMPNAFWFTDTLLASMHTPLHPQRTSCSHPAAIH